MPIELYTYAKIAKIINDTINIKKHNKYKIIIYEINIKIIISNKEKILILTSNCIIWAKKCN